MRSPDGGAYPPVSRFLGVFLTVFGIVCCLIAMAHIAVGPRAVIGSIAVNSTMDGEDRFFSALFLGFGSGVIWTARDPVGRGFPLRWLLAVFFIGGMAPAISALQVGLPNQLYCGLGLIELLLPPLVALWLAAAVRAET